MLRRSHRKSRKGCLQCKQRHVKCDETHPSCVHCLTAQLQCSFAFHAVTSSRTAPKDEVASLQVDKLPTTDSNSSNTNPRNTREDVGLFRKALQPAGDTGPLNLTHMALFYHFMTVTYNTYGYDEKEIDIRQLIVRHALDAPFLMYEVLAFTALHRSITEPMRASFYQQQSAELLSQALAGFQDVSRNIDEENICSAFLFSGFIGLHFFCDTFNQSANTDLNTFLDQLVHSIRVLQGVRAVIGSHWDVLLKSELKPILDRSDPPEGSFQSDENVEQLEELLGMIRNSQNLSIEDRAAYESAIDQLVIVHRQELVRSSEHKDRDSRRAMAWPISIAAEYTELLAQRKPEALVILAYYSVRLDKCSKLWAIGTAGQVLLSSVEAYLGPEWGKWLAWPLSQVSRVHRE